jgi:hypothetical protein
MITKKSPWMRVLDKRQAFSFESDKRILGPHVCAINSTCLLKNRKEEKNLIRMLEMYMN